MITYYTVPERWHVKQKPRDIIILHMCTKNYDQMMYSYLWTCSVKTNTQVANIKSAKIAFIG